MLEKNFTKIFRGITVLISGGTGMIGREVVKILCDAKPKRFSRIN